MQISVAIVEDDKHYNNALKSVLESHDEFLCAGQFYSGKEALEELPLIKPRIVLMDLQLHDYFGYQIIALLKLKMVQTRFIVISNYEEDEKIFDALKSGASGYLIKGENLEKIINSIKEANLGGAPMSNAVAQKVIGYFRTLSEKDKGIDLLTSTENEVLHLLAIGLQYKEIGHKKYVSTETIKKHIGNIYKKLGVNNKIEAINFLNQQHNKNRKND